ncbi:MAG: outer membrane protein assembly factor BamA [Nitrospirota bacterium]|nr:outer membrane protein assembly factor BamA [Nitrospirota bacterium]
MACWIRSFCARSLMLLLVFSGALMFMPVNHAFSEEVPASQEMIQIKVIEVKGNRKIEESTIRSKLTMKVGDAFDPAVIRADIKKLYGIGYFDDIKVSTEGYEGGLKLVFLVVEKPVVREVQFDGNKKLETDKLREKLTIIPNSLLNQQLIADNTEKLRAYYEEEGYFHAEIVPIVKTVSKNEAVITYQISEGSKVTLAKVEFEGNKALSSRKIKKVMSTQSWWMFSWFDQTGVYKKEYLQYDLENIKALYHNNGYIYVQIGEPRVTFNEKKTKVSVKIPIIEGDQFKVGSVSIKGNTLYSEKELLAKTKQKSGEVYSREKMSKDLIAINEMYGEKGRAFVNVVPTVDTNQQAKTVAIALDVDEGAEASIGRINIGGNVKTRDKVIRREIRLDEGDQYNSRLLRRSRERLTNLNYFETVDVVENRRPGLPIIDLDVKVKEKPTGYMSVGGGYSSVDKFVAMAEISQGNLFGRGETIKLKAELGSRRTSYNFSFIEPWLMDKEIYSGINLYNEKREFQSYDRNARGGNVFIGKRFSEYWNHGVSYTYEKVKLEDISPGASQWIREQEGDNLNSSIGYSITRDSRDSNLAPMSGSRNSLALEFAGLGGDYKFYKSTLDSSWYFPFIWETTFHLRGKVGYVGGYSGESVPIGERFYAGGINSLRGFRYGYVGPKDPASGDYIGGNKTLIFNAEYIFPLVPESKIRGVVFFDAGNVYASNEEFGSDFRYDAGAGIRWLSPVGPLRLEWGYNLDSKEGERKSVLEFTIGSYF